MTRVHFTEKPPETVADLSSDAPFQLTGDPVRIPAILLCQAAGPGQRACGKTWVANTPTQFVEKSADRRKHEETCRGGLIVAGA